MDNGPKLLEEMCQSYQDHKRGKFQCLKLAYFISLHNQMDLYKSDTQGKRGKNYLPLILSVMVIQWELSSPYRLGLGSKA